MCYNKRIKRNKVFKGIAMVGKSTMGWFIGFKLHLIINDKGEILSFYLSQGNTDDRDVKAITSMTQKIFEKIFGNKVYISKALSDLLFGNGIQPITQVRRNMKTKALSNEEKLLLRKRSVIETVNDELKNICQVEHARHRLELQGCTQASLGIKAVNPQNIVVITSCVNKNLCSL